MTIVVDVLAPRNKTVLSLTSGTATLASVHVLSSEPAPRHTFGTTVTAGVSVPKIFKCPSYKTWNFKVCGCVCPKLFLFCPKTHRCCVPDMWLRAVEFLRASTSTAMVMPDMRLLANELLWAGTLADIVMPDVRLCTVKFLWASTSTAMTCQI